MYNEKVVSINFMALEVPKSELLMAFSSFRIIAESSPPPPSGTELSNGQAAKLAVKDMMDDRPRMYDSPPTTYTHQQIVQGPFRKNAFSHSIISVHSQRAALSGAFIYQRWSHDSAEFCSE